MKTFKDYDTATAIDKITECLPYINKIIGDAEIMGTIQEKDNLFVVGGEIIKKYETESKALIKILDGDPDNIFGAVAAMGQLFFDVIGSKDYFDFFTHLAKKAANK